LESATELAFVQQCPPLNALLLNLPFSFDALKAADIPAEKRLADQLKERLVFDGDDQWSPVVAFSSKGDRLALSGPNHSIRPWDLTGPAPNEQVQFKGTGKPVSSVVFSPDDKTLASGSNGGTQLWDLSGGSPRAIEPLMARLGLASYPIKSCMGFSMVFSLDGKCLIAADQVSRGSWQPSKPAVCIDELGTGKRLYESDLSVPRLGNRAGAGRPACRGRPARRHHAHPPPAMSVLIQ
jgi:WD40 repeat protein